MQNTTTVLTAMITPAILILASGSLSLTTSQRLNRSMERTRSIYAEFEEIKYGKKVVSEEERVFMNKQLLRAARRSQLMQRAMTLLYIAICFFIFTSFLLGISVIFQWRRPVFTISTAMVGAAFLLAASIFLILETRIGLGAVNEEMRFRRRENFLISKEDTEKEDRSTEH